MSNLSDHVGFSAGGGGGGGVYDTQILLDKGSFNLQDESSYLTQTDGYNYGQAVRIRGLDDSSKAYFGFNCMTQTSPGSGQMRHSFTLFSADQSTGAITKENIRHMHTNSSYYYDYSTMCRTADEWTGRYSYHGNIPHSGQSHTYSYHNCFVYGTSSGSYTSQHQNATSYYPASNDCTYSSYVAPTERRLGGATNHVMAMYNSSSYASIYEFDYGYSTSSLNMQSTGSVPVTNSGTSTNYQVALFTQDTTTNQPYYDAFHSFQEGLYARNRSSQSWVNFVSTAGLSDKYFAFFLSNGSTYLKTNDSHYIIDNNNNVNTIPVANQLPAAGPLLYNWYKFAWNVGEDEWLQALPGGKWLKFRINPSNGYVTASNVLETSSTSMASYDQYYQYDQGFYSSFSPTSVNPSTQAFTFGNENSLGSGYGQSKLAFMGFNSSGDKRLTVATYDIADLVSTLSYS